MRAVAGAAILATMLAGCMTGAPTYHGPAETDDSAAVVMVGAVAESYSVSQNNSWIQIVAVDGDSTGPAPWVRVSPGEHQFKIRHHDPYATFYGNQAHEIVAFQAEPGGKLRKGLPNALQRGASGPCGSIPLSAAGGEPHSVSLAGSLSGPV